MPAAIAIPAIATAVSGGAAAAGTMVGAHKASNASRRAAEVQARADADTLAFEREREAELRRQWEADQAFQAQKFAAEEEERAYTRRIAEEREARMQPYRQASAAALGRLGTMLGIQLPQGAPSRGGGAAASPGGYGLPGGSGMDGSAPIPPGWQTMTGPSGDPRLPPTGNAPGGMSSDGQIGHITRGGTRPLGLPGSPWSMDGSTPTSLPPGSMTLGAQLNLPSRRRVVPGSY